jgi:hypothetical protein
MFSMELAYERRMYPSPKAPNAVLASVATPALIEQVRQLTRGHGAVIFGKA